jgi:hypothetical protein
MPGLVPGQPSSFLAPQDVDGGKASGHDVMEKTSWSIHTSMTSAGQARAAARRPQCAHGKWPRRSATESSGSRQSHRRISGKGGKVILLAHFSRPRAAIPRSRVKPVAAASCAGDQSQWPSPTVHRPPQSVGAMHDGDIFTWKTHFHKGRERRSRLRRGTGGKLIWVNDAFSAAHRAHASPKALGHTLPAYAGRHHAGRARRVLGKALDAPIRSFRRRRRQGFIKIDLLENLVTRVPTRFW